MLYNREVQKDVTACMRTPGEVSQGHWDIKKRTRTNLGSCRSQKLKISASSLAKHEFSGAGAGSILLHLNSDQTSFPMQPIDSSDSAFPSTSQPGTSLFIRLRDFPLCPASITESFPLLRRNSREKRLVQCVKKVEIGNVWGAPVSRRPDDHGPRELI